MDRVTDGQFTDEVSADDVTRPAPMEPIADRVRAWVAWFGLARIVVSAASMVIVCAGAVWLVRSPPPSAEATLPRASTAVVPSSTLPAPATQTVEVADAKQERPSGGHGGGVTVHVAGAVEQPGVHRLAADARVDDAIDAAGGPTRDADVDALNLAAILADGMRVYVPEHGEAVAPLLVVPPTGSGATSAPTGPVDINRADVDQLDALPGVGPATAAAIIAERDRNGPFLTVDDLERVPGIGPAKLAGLRELVIA